MRHRKAGRKLKRTNSHKKALLRNLATELFRHKRIHTTLAKAKELRPYAERIITRAKVALAKEQQNMLPEGHTIDIHNRRIVFRDIQDKKVLEELFDAIAPAVNARQGGYTRIVKTGTRRGDAGEAALIELVDWNTSVQETSKKRKKSATKAKGTTAASTDKATAPKKAASKSKAKKDEVVAEEIVEVAPVAEAVAETPVVEVVAETPVVEAVAETQAAEEVVAEAVAETPNDAPENDEAKTSEESEEEKTA